MHARMSLPVVGFLALLPHCLQGAEPADLQEKLLAVYRTQPQGYPPGKEYAQPDLSVPFRWHFYHDGAIERFDDAKMRLHADPYNPLEDQGVRVERDSPVKWKFVPERATEGKHSLQVDFPAQAIAAGKAVVRIEATAGGLTFSEYLRPRGGLTTASCYGPHYRWIKLDAFNPAKAEVRIRVSGVPFVLRSGQNIVTVKTADAVSHHYQCLFGAIPVEVVSSPANADVTLYFDHVRMEQEVPAAIGRQGKLLQFAARGDAKDPPVLAPGFTAVEVDTLHTPERGFGWTAPRATRQPHGHSFRSNEHGLLWGCCLNADAPFRVDLPKGRYGIFVFGAPTGNGFQWAKGLPLKVNGRDHLLLEPRSTAEVRRAALGGEAWDFRPGACVWEALVKQPYYPPLNVVYEEAIDGRLLIEFPKALALHALLIFPEADKEAALRELGRLNYLLAESWDVAHPWIKGGYARRSADGHPYIGVHDEMVRPESIPARLQALKLSAADFTRGFVTFERGLTEALYPDSIPTPQEVAFRELRCLAVPGQSVCATLGLLPLASVRNLRITASDLTAGEGTARIAAERIDVRVSRQHQKTMQFGHHNHDYNYQEHYLVRRPTLDLVPGAARRIYFDVAVPADAVPGEYTGKVNITTADGKVSAVPLVLEVLPVRLEAPPVYFAGSWHHPLLKDYGFNTFPTSFEEAEKRGYRGYLGSAVTAAPKNRREQIEAGLQGKAPRGFFGSYVNGQPLGKPLVDSLLQELPGIDLLSATVPLFAHKLDWTHEWSQLGPRAVGTPQVLSDARQAGKPFWFIDGLRHSKEQAARFTFGVWLWRLGASGRFTTLAAHLQYGGGTARSTYPFEPYFTLLDVTTCNVDRAIQESLVEGETNPCRDLVLLRAGIDDYRWLHTLGVWIDRAEARMPGGTALIAARKFREQLAAEVSLDLAQYYDGRAGAYGENWQPVPDNPWTTEKFDRLRQDTAQHIVALKKALGE
jgi:hypothetical protein